MQYPVGKSNYFDVLNVQSSSIYSWIIGSVGSDFALRIVPIIVGVGILLAVYFISKEVLPDNPQLGVLFYIVSPLFVYSCFILSAYTLSLLFIIWGFYFIHYKLKRTGYLLFYLSIFLPPINLIIVSMLLIYSYTKNRMNKYDILNFMLILLLSITVHLISYFRHGAFQVYNNIPNLFITDMGAQIGLSIFAILLGFYYLILYSDKLFIIFFSIIFGLSFVFGNHIMIYLNVIVVFLAARGFVHIFFRNWQIESIRLLSMVAIICGLFLSFHTYAVNIDMPNPMLVDSLDWLDQNVNDAVVLSSQNNGIYIKYYADNDPILSEFYKDNYKTIYNDTMTVYNTRNLKVAREYIAKYNVSYLLIDNNMRDTFWDSDDDGLLFLLSNKQTFDKVFMNDFVEVYSVR